MDRLAEIPDPLQGRVAAPVRRGVTLAEVSPARSAVRGRRWAALGASLAWVAVNIGGYGLRPDIDTLPFSYLIVQVLAPYALAVVALSGALHPGRFGLGADRRVLVGLTLAGPVLFALLAFWGSEFYPEALRDGALAGSLPCLETTMFWAVVPLGLAALTLRRAFASGAGWRAALVGGSCGLLAGGTINLHCPNADVLHIVVGHELPMVVTSVVGAMVMARWTRA